MYARSIKISFKDKMSKEMFINFTDTKADSQGINNGTLLKFIFDNSETQATLVLVFPDYKTYKKDQFSSSFVFNNPNETERCGCGESFKI